MWCGEVGAALMRGGCLKPDLHVANGDLQLGGDGPWQLRQRAHVERRLAEGGEGGCQGGGGERARGWSAAEAMHSTPAAASGSRLTWPLLPLTCSSSSWSGSYLRRFPFAGCSVGCAAEKTCRGPKPAAARASATVAAPASAVPAAAPLAACCSGICCASRASLFSIRRLRFSAACLTACSLYCFSSSSVRPAAARMLRSRVLIWAWFGAPMTPSNSSTIVLMMAVVFSGRAHTSLPSALSTRARAAFEVAPHEKGGVTGELIDERGTSSRCSDWL